MTQLKPNANWSEERLLTFAKECLGTIKILEKKTAIQSYRAGHALTLLRDKLKKGKNYHKWLKDNGVPHTTAYYCIRLYAKAPNEKAVEGMGITAANNKF